MGSWGLMAGLPLIGLLLLALGGLTQDECNIENIIMGRYFHPHPTICTKYLQCAQRATGGWYGKQRDCAPGLFWDVYSTSCRTPFELRRPCANDPCRAGMDFREAENHCRSYFKCQDLTTYEMLCCQHGDKYDPETRTCVLDITRECTNDVCTDGPALMNITCRLSTFPLDRRFFYETVPAFGEMTRIMRSCPAGTAFNEEDCGCTERAPPPLLPGCYSSLMLNFAGNRVRDFEFDHFVTNLAVGLNQQLSLGLFRGEPARLIIPRYANQDWRDEFVFYVTFATQGIQQTDAVLLSNSGCSDEIPSIKLAVQNNNILEGTIVTEDGTRTSVSVPFSDMGLNEAIFLYEGAILQLRVLLPNLQIAASSANVPAAPSNVALRRCAFQVGYGTGSNFFRGFIDQVQILLCK